MPSRNVVKEFAPHQYYHIYNRGVEKRSIFLDDQDYAVFLNLLKQYLTGETSHRTHLHQFDNLSGQISLIAYCLMPNHFHLMVYQVADNAVTRLMRRVMTGYVMYFNKRHQRVGALFQGRYRASNIDADAYLQHISRYVHLNPKNFNQWPYSSLPYYKGEKQASWLNTEPIMALFDHNPEEYMEFVSDYEASQKELSLLKWQLANDSEI